MNLPMNNATMSSREIARITGKRHSDVMRDIRNLLTQLNGSHNERKMAFVGKVDDRTPSDKKADIIDYLCDHAFEGSGYSFFLSEYVDDKKEKRPEYILTQKDVLLLISGYNALLRGRVINRWEELEMKSGRYLKNSEEYGRRIELLESGISTLIGAMTNLTTMIAATLQPAAPQPQPVTPVKPTPHPDGSRQKLVDLVERAVAIAGSQVNLTNWMGVSESVISDIKSTRTNRPGKIMTNYFIDCCNKVVQLGSVPDELPVKPKGIHRRNRTNKANLIADICKIKDDNLRLSLLNKVTGGRAL